jgi:hypothetical protein
VRRLVYESDILSNVAVVYTRPVVLISDSGVQQLVGLSGVCGRWRRFVRREYCSQRIDQSKYMCLE